MAGLAPAVSALAKSAAAGEPVRRQLLQCGGTAASTCSGTLRPELPSGRGFSVITLAMIACAAGPGERRLACEHLVESRAQGIDVAPRVHRRSPLPAPGAMYCGVPSEGRSGSFVRRPPDRTRQGDAEIGYNGALAFEQDVLRLDVSVDDALRCGRTPRASATCVARPTASVHAQLTLPPQAIPERLSTRRTASVYRAAVRPRRSRRPEECADAAGGR